MMPPAKDRKNHKLRALVPVIDEQRSSYYHSKQAAKHQKQASFATFAPTQSTAFERPALSIRGHILGP